MNRLSEFDNLNEKVMQLVQNGVDVKEKLNVFRKSAVKLTQQGAKSPQKAQKKGSKSVHNKSLPYIKGLKEFKLKML
jgi:hypothetical protein